MPPIGKQHRACNETGFVRQQEQHQVGNGLESAWSALGSYDQKLINNSFSGLTPLLIAHRALLLRAKSHFLLRYALWLTTC